MDHKLTLFFYILLRDHLPSGAIEDIMEKHVEPHAQKDTVYSNKHMEAYAKELARRLTE